MTEKSVIGPRRVQDLYRAGAERVKVLDLLSMPVKSLESMVGSFRAKFLVGSEILGQYRNFGSGAKFCAGQVFLGLA